MNHDNHRRFSLALVLGAPMLGVAIAAAAGCGDDAVFNATDAGSFEAGPLPESGPSVQPEGGDSAVPSTCGDPTGAPERLLLTINGATSEVAAFNLASKSVDGRFDFKAATGQSFSFGTDPYVVEQGDDIVARMNAQRPWEAISTWNVAGDDRVDGGPNAQPVAVVVPSCGKGYVLRFESNKIAVIDTTKSSDGGAPTGYIDLSSLVQAEDSDGRVEMTSALYIPSKKLIYVLLGGWDKTKVATDGFTALCAASKPSIIAIDPDTDKVVSLGGTAPGGGIALEGYSPTLGNELVYDAARDRLLVFNTGCNVDTGGGVAGPVITRRTVDEADLATKQSKTVLDVNALGFPGTLALLDGNRAALTFFFPNQAFFWDPSSPNLGPEIPGSLDYGAFDSKGNLVGGRRTPIDGGAMVEVLSVPYASGDGGTLDAAAVQTLGTNPFTDNSGFIGGAEVWPRP